MSKKFIVLLSRQRSGTNALRSVLESHPKIHCCGEIMSYADKDIPDSKIESDLNKKDSFVSFAKNQCGDRYDDPDNHIKIFEEFVQVLHKMHDKEITAIDLKYNSTHLVSARWKELHEVPLFNWFQANEIPVIRLRRDNYLKVLLSDQIAEMRQQWHDLDPSNEKYFEGAKPRAMNATVPNKEGDMEYLLHRIKCLQLEDTIVDATFRNYDHLCQVTYSEMFPELGCPLNEQVMQRISEFLGIEYDYETTPWTTKSIPRPVWEVITNWQQVSAALRGTQFEHFLADELMFQNGDFQEPPVVESPVAFSTAADLLAKVTSK
ncbi:hypothetical protein N9Y42_03830 [Mariniblastus sp.]|nr:hypothetical protein [Mariniblastus sp.]